MDESHQPIVSERLSLFFWVTLGAFCRGQRKSVNEAESRLQWDTLIFHILNSLASKDDGVHITVIHQSLIRWTFLPQNHTYLLRTFFIICIDIISMSAMNIYDSPKVYDQQSWKLSQNTNKTKFNLDINAV